MIRILTIVTGKFGVGGITNVILNYYQNLNKLDFKMDFVVVQNNLESKIIEEFELNNSKYYILESRKKNIIKYEKELIRIIKEGQYDIVHVHGNSATMLLEMYAAYKAGCKVRIAHSHNSTCMHKGFDKFLRPFFYKYCNNAFACGQAAGKWLFSENPFYIIPNGIEIEKFAFDSRKRNELRKKYHLENKKVFAHVGRFNEQKNQKFIVEVFKEYLKKDKNSVLILIGSGMDFEKIKNMVKKLKIEKYVIFTGEIDNVAEWLNACDLMLLPSKYEGFPVVIIEWQISGLPCLVSNKVSNEIKLTDLVQFLDLDKPEEWIESMKKIDFNSRPTQSENAIKIIKEKGFDIKENTKTLERIYRDLVNQNKT